MLDSSTKNKKSFITICDEKIIEVSEGFTNLTGYLIDELAGKSYIVISQMLKFNPQNIFEYINDNIDIYLFTKLLEPREVTVSLKIDKDKKNTTYFFDEKENYRLENKFAYVEQLYLDNHCGIAIYSAQDLVLLKANKKYFNYLDEPYNKKENCVGKKIDQIIHNCIEVTERVLNRKLIEEQTAKIERQDKKIEAIINLADEHISIFNKKGKFIKHSKVIMELFEFNEVNDINEINDKIKIFDIDRNEISIEDSEFSFIKGW